MKEFKSFSDFNKKESTQPSVSEATEYKEEGKEKGIKLPNTLDNDTISELNSRLEDEYHAYFFYINAANYCKGVNYKKAAIFFEGEYANELLHAKTLMDYMSDWNIKPTVQKTQTDYKFESLVDVIEQAYDIEYELLKKYNITSSKIMNSGDIATFDFLSYFRNVQLGEVKEYSDFLNALQLINKDNKLDILYFEQNYF